MDIPTPETVNEVLGNLRISPPATSGYFDVAPHPDCENCRPRCPKCGSPVPARGRYLSPQWAPYYPWNESTGGPSGIVGL